MAQCNIEAGWRERPETPDQIAERIQKMLVLLRPIAPEFARWYQVLAEDDMPELDDGATWLASAVAANMCKGDLGEPIPNLGYSSITMNRPVGAPQRPGQVYLNVSAGSRRTNGVALAEGNRFDLPAHLLAYPVVKQTILAFSQAFEPLFSVAGPIRLWRDIVRSDYKEGPIILPCWMIHLSPPLAQRVAPPSNIISEPHADGSLFLSVTDETFDLENPEHVAAAHRLFAVLDPLQEKLPPHLWRR